jgi:hypothetical protein
MMGHVIERCSQASFGEHSPARTDQEIAIAGGVLSQGLICHPSSIPAKRMRHIRFSAILV